MGNMFEVHNFFLIKKVLQLLEYVYYKYYAVLAQRVLGTLNITYRRLFTSNLYFSGNVPLSRASHCQKQYVIGF